jgi:hypothetical protein
MWDRKDAKSLESLAIVEKRPVSELVSETPTRHLFVCNVGAGFCTWYRIVSSAILGDSDNSFLYGCSGRFAEA